LICVETTDFHTLTPRGYVSFDQAAGVDADRGSMDLRGPRGQAGSGDRSDGRCQRLAPFEEQVIADRISSTYREDAKQIATITVEGRFGSAGSIDFLDRGSALSGLVRQHLGEN
jgi:hypothetical protein